MSSGIPIGRAGDSGHLPQRRLHLALPGDGHAAKSGRITRERRGRRNQTAQDPLIPPITGRQGEGKYLLLADLQSWGGEFTVRSMSRSSSTPPTRGAGSALLDTRSQRRQTVNIVGRVHNPLPDFRFGWGSYEPGLISAEAKEYAAKADVAVVAAGFDARTEARAPTAHSSCPGARMR